MSRRTDVLNKYPAPRVSTVNQAVRPGLFAGVLHRLHYATTIYRFYTSSSSSSATTSSILVLLYLFWSFVLRRRTGSSGINQPAEIRVRGAAGIFTIGRRRARLVYRQPGEW